MTNADNVRFVLSDGLVAAGVTVRRRDDAKGAIVFDVVQDDVHGIPVVGRQPEGLTGQDDELDLQSAVLQNNRHLLGCAQPQMDGSAGAGRDGIKADDLGIRRAGHAIAPRLKAASCHSLLIPEWRRAWRLSTVWAAALLGALSMVQAEVLPQLQALVPPQRWPWVTLGFALAIVVLRIVAQPKALDPNTGDRP